MSSDRTRLRRRCGLGRVMWNLAVAMAFLPVAAAGFEVGEPFPDLYLPSLEDGKPLSLADFRGEKIVLHVFASW